MGEACIKITKYLLFLFNLLFFVSVAAPRLSRTPRAILGRCGWWVTSQGSGLHLLEGG